MQRERYYFVLSFVWIIVCKYTVTILLRMIIWLSVILSLCCHSIDGNWKNDWHPDDTHV